VTQLLDYGFAIGANADEPTSCNIGTSAVGQIISFAYYVNVDQLGTYNMRLVFKDADNTERSYDFSPTFDAAGSQWEYIKISNLTYKIGTYTIIAFGFI